MTDVVPLRVWVVTEEPDHGNSTIIALRYTPEAALDAAERHCGRALRWQPSGDGFTAPDPYASPAGYDVQPFEVLE